MSQSHQSPRVVNRSPLAKRDKSTTENLGFSELKRIILEASGYSPELLGEHLGAALATLNEGLVADKTQYFTHAGVVTDQRTDADYNTRLKAAAELASIITVLGDMKQQGNGGVGGGTHITLNVPFLADLKVEQDSQVIDVTPSSDETKSQ